MVGQGKEIIALGPVAAADLFGRQHAVGAGRMGVQVAAPEAAGGGEGVEGFGHVQAPLRVRSGDAGALHPGCADDRGCAEAADADQIGALAGGEAAPVAQAGGGGGGGGDASPSPRARSPQRSPKPKAEVSSADGT